MTKKKSEKDDSSRNYDNSSSDNSSDSDNNSIEMSSKKTSASSGKSTSASTRAKSYRQTPKVAKPSKTPRLTSVTRRRVKPPKECTDKTTFADCELAIVRMAADRAEKKMGRRVVQSEDVKRMIQILEQFLRRKKLVCYGGTAINNILPETEQFYDKEVEVPDYDFFSGNAFRDSKELADLYHRAGFTEVEAKSGVHHGTYKVFVNFMGIADITQLEEGIFKVVQRDAIRIGGILYAPPNFLRMAMYLELSRPVGDVSRWEKVLKRLTLLNRYYPVTSLPCNQLKNDGFQREMSRSGSRSSSSALTGDGEDNDETVIYETLKRTFVHDGVVFFGGYAMSLYARYIPGNRRGNKEEPQKIADFDVLSNDPERTAELAKSALQEAGIRKVTIRRREPVGEIVPLHYEILVGRDTVAFVYKPIACHSYNAIGGDGTGEPKIKVASIDTMLSFYLAFLYANKPYYNQFAERLLCMADFLFRVQKANRLEQRGLLRRFTVTCYGHQETLEEIREKKAAMYAKLKGKQNSREYQEWFLNYRPMENHGRTGNQKQDNKKQRKTRRRKQKRGLFW